MHQEETLCCKFSLPWDRKEHCSWVSFVAVLWQILVRGGYSAFEWVQTEKSLFPFACCVLSQSIDALHSFCCLVCLLWCFSQLLCHTAQDQLTVFRALVRRAWLQSLTLLPKKEHLFHFSWAGIYSVTFEDACRPAFRSVRFHHIHWW